MLKSKSDFGNTQDVQYMSIGQFHTVTQKSRKIFRPTIYSHVAYTGTKLSFGRTSDKEVSHRADTRGQLGERWPRKIDSAERFRSLS